MPYVPAGQGVQLDCPASSAKVPGEQTSQTQAPCSPLQLMTSTSPDGTAPYFEEAVPLGHSVHCVRFCRPSSVP